MSIGSILMQFYLLKLVYYSFLLKKRYGFILLINLADFGNWISIRYARGQLSQFDTKHNAAACFANRKVDSLQESPIIFKSFHRQKSSFALSSNGRFLTPPAARFGRTYARGLCARNRGGEFVTLGWFRRSMVATFGMDTRHDYIQFGTICGRIKPNT